MTKKSFSIFFLFTLSLISFGVLFLPKISLAAGEVATYSFNEGSGTIAADSSGNNNNGTLVNGPTWITGKYGNAISFDGTNGKVSLPSSLNVSFPFTIETWIYPTSYADWRAVFSKRDSPSSNDMRFDIGLSITSGQVYFYTGSVLASSYVPTIKHLDSSGSRDFPNWFGLSLC